jgi:hypothetical protein
MFFPNAEEVREVFNENDLTDEDLEDYWRAADSGQPSGYYLPDDL